jgi:hypothetical protein
LRYINTLTNEYPQFIGDVQRIIPGWQPTSALPDGWFEVKEVAMPEPSEPGTVVFEDFPEMVDGEYERVWKTRSLSAEEIELMAAPESARQRFLDLGFTQVETDFIFRRLAGR